MFVTACGDSQNKVELNGRCGYNSKQETFRYD